MQLRGDLNERLPFGPRWTAPAAGLLALLLLITELGDSGLTSSLCRLCEVAGDGPEGNRDSHEGTEPGQEGGPWIVGDQDPDPYERQGEDRR